MCPTTTRGRYFHAAADARAHICSISRGTLEKGARLDESDSERFAAGIAFRAFRFGHEVERYNNAIRHLSDFDRELTTHRFDKGKLDRSIGDVQSVIDHNTLSGRSRRELLRDVMNLRRLRADYDAWHG